MSLNWRVTSLGELCSFQEGYVNPSQNHQEYFDGDIKWIRAIDLNNGYVHNTSRTLTKAGFESAGKSALLFEPNTIVISKSGTIGRLGIITDYMCGNRAVINIKPHNTEDSRFIYYHLLSRQKEFADLAVGSVQKNLYVSILEKIIVNLPPLPIQKKIADILSSLDDKIELNTRMNKVLEDIAQALFIHWFVEFEFPNHEGKPYKSSGGKMVDSEIGLIPEGWKVGTIGDIAEITMGQSPDGKSYNENGVGTVFYQGRGEFGERFPTQRLFTTEPKRMAKIGDVLLSVRAPVGDINLAIEECCIGRGLAAIHSKFKQSSFILYEIINLKSTLEQFNGNGTVFGSINKDSLHSIKITIPPQNIIDQFENNIQPMDRKIKNNHNENIRLSKLRDTLLPKLMNNKYHL